MPAQRLNPRLFDAASYFASSHLTRDSQRRSEVRAVGEGRPPAFDGVFAFVRLVLRLPRVDLRLSDGAAGAAIRSHLSAQWRGIAWRRIAQDVLTLPERPEDYFRGRSRQALRTNLRHAQRDGIRCRQVANAAALREFTSTFVPPPSAAAELEQHIRARPEDSCWVATDAHGRTIGVLIVTVDTEVALLRYLVGTVSEARYLLHAELVNFLCVRGGRYLTVAGPSPLALAPGLQYFQRRLGYEVMHLRLRRASRPRHAATRPPPPRPVHWESAHENAALRAVSASQPHRSDH